MAYSVGTLIADQYRVEKVFSGGMGFVYVVRDEVVGKRFAIKQLPDHHVRKKIMQERFRREASSWLLLDHHPNIVQAHSFIARQDSPLLILEYIDGPTLERVWKRAKRLSPAQVVSYSRQFCHGMYHAHNQQIPDRGVGLLHRDIKPGNILLSSRNQLKITDFGLAKVEGEETLTGEGNYVGTVAYSSPEQLRAAGNVTKASDVYSYGTVMYQMLCGRPPYWGRNPAEFYEAIHKGTFKPIDERCPGLHPKLTAIVHKSLEREPQQRYSDFGELLGALSELGSLVSPEDWFCDTCGFIGIHRTTSCPICTQQVDGSDDAADRDKLLRTPVPSDDEPVLPPMREAGPILIPEDDDAPLPVPKDDLSAPAISSAASTQDSDISTGSQSFELHNLNPQSNWDLTPEKHYLVQLTREGKLIPWALEKTGYSIGRGPKMRIRIRDPKVAAFQLYLAKLTCGWLAVNPRSQNPVSVNGRQTRQQLLHSADILKVGGTWLTYVGPVEDAEPLAYLPGHWIEHDSMKSLTVRSRGSNPTRYQSHEIGSCSVELPGGNKVTSSGEPIRIGRSPICSVRLDDASIAPIQAMVSWQDDGPHLVNLTAANVELVGGSHVSDHRIGAGDLVQVGSTPLRFTISTVSQKSLPEPQPVRRFAATILSGPQRGQTMVLPTGDPVVIGRHEDCDAMITEDRYVSRRHLELTAGPETVQIQDLGSRHGFSVNQSGHTSESNVRIGDILTVGKTSMLIHYELGI